MNDINHAVTHAIDYPVRCKHVDEWPSVREILAGAILCPFCLVHKLSKELSDGQRMHEQLTSEANRRIEQLNRSNTALQRLAMDMLRTSDDAERLLRINQEQYDEVVAA